MVRQRNENGDIHTELSIITVLEFPAPCGNMSSYKTCQWNF